MKDKKTPERFSIRFDPSNPQHRQVIEILSQKGRNAARYIADAVIAYEAGKEDSLENTVTEVVTKMLGLKNLSSEPTTTSEENDSFDYNEIADDLAGFKKF